MVMYVKICGLTHVEQVTAAVEAGADAIGFVFASSPRQVSIDQAIALAEPARGKVDVISVTQHPTQAELEQIIQHFKPTFFQTDYKDLDQIELPSDIHALPVFRDDQSVTDTKYFTGPILFESEKSGAGELADWGVATRVATQHKTILAGGLNVGNVINAIHTVRPWGVDVSSGVEKSKGVKDPEKVFAFVRQARSIS